MSHWHLPWCDEYDEIVTRVHMALTESGCVVGKPYRDRAAPSWGCGREHLEFDLDQSRGMRPDYERASLIAGGPEYTEAWKRGRWGRWSNGIPRTKAPDNLPVPTTT